MIPISSLHLLISDLAHNADQLISHGLEEPSLLTLLIVFTAGLLTSLGPCSLSLIPVTVAYMAGFNEKQKTFTKSLIFCTGIVFSLIILGSISGLIGKIYGQLPSSVGIIVPIITILMGLNLLGILKFTMPNGPELDSWKGKIPEPLAPIAAGMMFGLAASPCTTPVLAVLLTWITDKGNTLSGVVLLACFGSGQVVPLLLAGTTAATIPRILSMRGISKWIPSVSGMIFLSTGLLSLFERWV